MFVFHMKAHVTSEQSYHCLHDIFWVEFIRDLTCEGSWEMFYTHFTL